MKNKKWMRDLNIIIFQHLKDNNITEIEMLDYFTCLIISLSKECNLSYDEFKVNIDCMLELYKKEGEAND